MKKIIIILMISVFALGACSALSGKPSKADVVDGINRKIDKSKEFKGADKSQLKELKKALKCTLEKAYDDLNDKTLEVLTDDDVSFTEMAKKIKGSQEKVLEKASSKCQ